MRLWGYAILAPILLIVLLIASEWRVWRADSKEAGARVNARKRFFRRGLCGVLLLSVFLVLAFPSPESVTRHQLFVKVLAALGLCCLVFVVVIWDLRHVAREVREQSAQDLLEYMKTAEQLQQAQRAARAVGRPENDRSANDIIA